MEEKEEGRRDVSTNFPVTSPENGLKLIKIDN